MEVTDFDYDLPQEIKTKSDEQLLESRGSKNSMMARRPSSWVPIRTVHFWLKLKQAITLQMNRSGQQSLNQSCQQ